jgi:hypothetical protein
MGKGKVPVYNKQIKAAVKLMGDYYSEGTVTKKTIKL